MLWALALEKAVDVYCRWLYRHETDIKNGHCQQSQLQPPSETPSTQSDVPHVLQVQDATPPALHRPVLTYVLKQCQPSTKSLKNKAPSTPLRCKGRTTTRIISKRARNVAVGEQKNVGGIGSQESVPRRRSKPYDRPEDTENHGQELSSSATPEKGIWELYEEALQLVKNESHRPRPNSPPLSRSSSLPGVANHTIGSTVSSAFKAPLSPLSIPPSPTS